MSKRSVIEGAFVQVSKLPSPRENAYPDCNYTATVVIHQIISGHSIQKRIILVLPGFFSRKYVPEAKYKVGDKFQATVVPFVVMPDKVKQTQQADEIEDVNLGIYFPIKIVHIMDFKKITNPVSFTEKGQNFTGHREFQSIDSKTRGARQASILYDLQVINRLLAEHGGDWGKWYDSLKEFRDLYEKQFEAKTQRWVGDSFFSAGVLPYDDKIYSPEFIKSIIAFKNYLAMRNVDLILVRVPTKGEVCADLFAPLPPDQVTNPYLLRMYKELLEADIEIITDIIPRAREARLKYPLMYWYQDFPEYHPAEGMAWVVAEEIAKRLNRYERIRTKPKTTFTIKEASHARCCPEARWPTGNSKFNPAEYVRFKVVQKDDGSSLTLTQGFDSPVLLVGSSYIAHPELDKGGSIPHYLAYLTGITPDIVFRSGADQAIPHAIAREGDAFLKNRIVCIFPFGPNTPRNALASLPIIVHANKKKIVLASFIGDDLQKHIILSPKTPGHVFKYLPDGSLIIHPVNHKVGEAGGFRLTLPQKISAFPFFIIEIEFKSTRGNPIVNATYSGQQDTIYRSWSDPASDDFFIFKTNRNQTAELYFTAVQNDAPVIIKSIRIIGLK